MKLSPEPNWATMRKPGPDIGGTIEELLIRTLTDIKRYPDLVLFMVRENDGTPLGSFTPEWFLDLPREHQLRFLTVAKRMHEGRECGYECHQHEVYGWVPEAGCPVHD